MVICVLDASALLRFLLAQPGGSRVMQLLGDTRTSSNRLVISSVNWGKVVSRIYRTEGKAASDALPGTMLYYGLEVVSVTMDHAAQAALLKVDLGIPYADAVCLSVALSWPGASLVTADFDFKAGAHLTSIEFLPAT